MNAGTFSQMERELLHRIAELAVSRAAKESDLARVREIEAAAAEGEKQRTNAAADKILAAESAKVDKVLAAELSRIADEEARESEQLSRRHETEDAALSRKISELSGVIEQERESARWMAETIAEPQEAKVQAQHDAWVRAVAALKKRLEVAETAAVGALGGRTARIDQIRGAAAAATADMPVNGQVAEIERLAVVAEHLAAAVPALVGPKLGHPVIVASVGALAGGIGAAGAFAAGLQGAGLAGAAAAGGVAGAAASLGGAALKRSRLPALCAELGGVLATARELASGAVFKADEWKAVETIQIVKRRDAEIAAIRHQLEVKNQELLRLRKETLPRLRAKHEADRRELTARAEAKRDQSRAVYEGSMNGLRGTNDAARAEADAKVLARIQKLEERQSTEYASMVESWVGGMRSMEELRRKIAARAEAIEPSAGATETRAALLDAVRIGSIQVELDRMAGGLSADPKLAIEMPPRFELPLMMDLNGPSSLIIDVGADPGGAGRREALRLVQSVLVRLMESLPPARARFTFFDPIGLGQSFAAFMHLADHDPALVSDKIWTDARHFEQRLVDLTEHMENVIQKYLRNEFPSIQAYNAAAGEVAEPFRFLVLADFPTNVSEEAARRLESVLASGPRCGVFTIVLAGGAGRPPSYIRMNEIERSGLVLRFVDGKFVPGQEPLARWPISLLPAADEAELTASINRLGERARGASRVKVPFEAIAPPMDRTWSLSSAEEIRVPIGRAGAKKLQHMTLGRGTAQHALIAGRTGSGKSTLFHVLITNLSLWYSPEQLGLYLLDFKKGVEFKCYAQGKLPHARVIAIESEREFGLSVLKRLDAELTARGEIFREAGVQDVAGYRRARGEDSMPRLVLIVDEFQEFFVEDDRVAQESALLLDRLVRQGRAFGMHVILGSQTLGGAFSIARTTIGQMGVRIALQCGEADSYLILSEDNSAARLLSRPGEAIYNDASGLLEGNSPFQIVWLDEDRRDEALGELRGRPGPARERTIVFEGSAPASIEMCESLRKVIAGQSPRGGRGARVFLGDPVWIKESTNVDFTSTAGSNLLVVGQNDEQMAGLLGGVMVSLAAWHAGRGDGSLVVLDAKPAGESAVDSALLDASGVPTKVCGLRESAAAVLSLAEELTRREADVALSEAGPAQYLIINGLQKFRDLRRSDDFDFSSSGEESAAKALARIVRDGPVHGIHVIAFCDTLANLERTVERGVVREFGARVVLQMNAADSTALIDSPGAGSLGRGRAILHLVETGGIEKFRCFALPGADWLGEVGRILRGRREAGAGLTG
jgi:DNA segregation ATPase FtsK/SpoIIIE, S-DNA-T family